LRSAKEAILTGSTEYLLTSLGVLDAHAKYNKDLITDYRGLYQDSVHSVIEQADRAVSDLDFQNVVLELLEDLKGNCKTEIDLNLLKLGV